MHESALHAAAALGLEALHTCLPILIMLSMGIALSREFISTELGFAVLLSVETWDYDSKI